MLVDLNPAQLDALVAIADHGSFDAAARQMPAGDITVLDQKDLAVTVQHHGTDPQRHAAGEPPIEMKNPPQDRLKALSHALQVQRP